MINFDPADIMSLIPEINAITQRLIKRINLLIVDDYAIIRNAITELFPSPLFNTIIATSEKEAREIIPKVPVWHAWLLDIAMEDNESGLKILSDYRQFPFTIMLSGIRSMSISSRAMQLGAFKVFDKDPSMLLNMHDDVCAMAALAYILNGSGTKYFPLFTILANGNVATASEWAQAACLTKRQLERICSMHLDLTPRCIVPLFHTIRFLLQQDELPVCDTADNDSFNLEEDSVTGRHISFVCKNIDVIFGDNAAES